VPYVWLKPLHDQELEDLLDVLPEDAEVIDLRESAGAYAWQVETTVFQQYAPKLQGYEVSEAKEDIVPLIRGPVV
jgi:hypothetical protein